MNNKSSIIENLDNFRSYLPVTSEIKTQEDYLTHRYKHYLNYELEGNCKLLTTKIFITMSQHFNTAQSHIHFEAFLSKYIDLIGDKSMRLLYNYVPPDGTEESWGYGISVICGIGDIDDLKLKRKIVQLYSTEVSNLFNHYMKCTGLFHLAEHYDLLSQERNAEKGTVITKIRCHIFTT